METYSKKKAVALGFDPSSNQAPVILAKGEGRLAYEIMKIAQTNEVKVIRDPDLSQLMSTLPIRSEIPENLYTIMAQVFGMVMRMRQEENTSSV